MATESGTAVIGADLVVLGEVRNGKAVEVLGAVRGTVVAEHVVVHSGGSIVGHLTASSAEIRGLLDGQIRVRNLISIGDGGAVRGDVRYGQLALAPGGDLAADVRNIPPELAGDFELFVRRGRSVRITNADLAALDPDDAPEKLVYRVSGAACGFVAHAGSPRQALETFTEAELDRGEVIFVHDGAHVEEAGFDVLVSDAAGATSGDPRRVTVRVIGA